MGTYTLQNNPNRKYEIIPQIKSICLFICFLRRANRVFERSIDLILVIFLNVQCFRGRKKICGSILEAVKNFFKKIK